MQTTKAKTNSWNESDFEIKKSGIKGIGKGLFALRSIKRGDTIGPYTGVIVDDDTCCTEPYASSHYTLWVCKDCNIVAEGENASYTRYINHSDKPNARFVVSTRWKKARVEALKRIRPGEEIFLDYGPYFWETVGISKKDGK
jgi:SET domain-containing protein